MSLFEKADINKINCLIDLHLHLDGALSLNNVKNLIKISGKNIDLSDEELSDRITLKPDCRNLNEFLSKFELPISFLQSKETIKQSIITLLEEQKQQGLIYCEIRFAPQLHLNEGLTMDEVFQAAIEGCKEGAIPCSLIMCCMIGAKKELNIETVKLTAKYLHNFVEAVDIAGAEGLFELEDHRYIFDLAKELNVPYTVHAGEAKGFENVDIAISFGTKRIGHGISAINSENTMQKLIEKGITLEMCPTSNLLSKAVLDIKDFPLIPFMEKGIFVTVNQDDPAIEGIDLKHEWKLLIDEFDMTYLEVKQLLLNSVNASFLELGKKVKLAAQIKEYFDREL